MKTLGNWLNNNKEDKKFVVALKKAENNFGMVKVDQFKNIIQNVIKYSNNQ